MAFEITAEISLGTFEAILGQNMTKIQNFRNPPKWCGKVSYMVTPPEICLKRAWGSICTLQAHSKTRSRNLKFDNFHHWTRKAKLWVCLMGAHTHPSPFISKFLVFLKKMEHFSYLDRLCTRKTRWFILGQSWPPNPPKVRFRRLCRKTKGKLLIIFQKTIFACGAAL